MKKAINTSHTLPSLGQRVRSTRPLAAVVTAAVTLTANAAIGQCDPDWAPVLTGMSRQSSGVQIQVLSTANLGSGPALYAGGLFDMAGGIIAESISKWDGTTWSALGDGFRGSRITALTEFNDGSGVNLYAGGRFDQSGKTTLNNIAKWNGSSWSPLGTGTDDHVSALVVFDDSRGSALYAGGTFTSAGGVSTSRIAKWDGTSWSTLGIGVNEAVNALCVFDDGSGPALFAGGAFTEAGGQSANYIAKWDGVSWSPLAEGLDESPRTLAVFNDGTGTALYAGGSFEMAGGVSANKVAKWDGSSWAPLGEGIAGSGYLIALAAFDDGSGEALYAGGWFSWAGSGNARHIARWDGTEWSPMGDGMGASVQALLGVDNMGTPALYVGGTFLTAGTTNAKAIARWRTPVPDVLTRLNDETREVRESVIFSIQATSRPGPMTLQWRKDGIPLQEDPPRITGTQTFSLRIFSLTLSDMGAYDAVLTNTCGSDASRQAQLTITCYPDCDQSTGFGELDLFDFLCFQSAFVTFEPYADCNGDTLLNIFDFLCFQNAFVAGCP